MHRAILPKLAVVLKRLKLYYPAMTPGRYDIEMREAEPMSLPLVLYDPEDATGHYPQKDLTKAALRGQVRYGESSASDLADKAVFAFEGINPVAPGYVVAHLPPSHGLAAGDYWYELEIDEAQNGEFSSFLAGQILVERGTSP